MQKITVELTSLEREAIEHYVQKHKLPWGLFWRKALRLVARNAQWIRRHAPSNPENYEEVP